MGKKSKTKKERSKEDLQIQIEKECRWFIMQCIIASRTTNFKNDSILLHLLKKFPAHSDFIGEQIKKYLVTFYSMPSKPAPGIVEIIKILLNINAQASSDTESTLFYLLLKEEKLELATDVMRPLQNAFL